MGNSGSLLPVPARGGLFVAEEGVRRPGIEETLFQLLENSGAGTMEQGNLLILLSLVNLMGIINIINYRIGADKGGGTGTAGPGPGAAGREGSPDTAPGGRGSPFDPSPLLDLLGRFAAPPGGPPRVPASGKAGDAAEPAADIGGKPAEKAPDKTGSKQQPVF
ncbi:MAG: hypothetical protein K6T66_02680 [Peptococcaceae bacterium]|nr:hypothetical protein [Peptococcaceae bacterium]